MKIVCLSFFIILLVVAVFIGVWQHYKWEDHPSKHLRADLEIDIPDDVYFEMDFELTDPEAEEDLRAAAEETVSVEFPDESVRVIISNLADLYELNVVIPESLDLETRMTVKFHNVTWRQVYDVVLEPFDHAYYEDRNIIKIHHIDELYGWTDTRVFPINYAHVSQLMVTLTPFIDHSNGGRILMDERTNTLIITENPIRLKSIAKLIEYLDRSPAQVMVEAKVFEVVHREQAGMGSPDRLINKMIGTNVSHGSTSTEHILRNKNTIYDPQAFEAVLSTLQQVSDARLVSNPSVVVLEGKEAHIKISERIPSSASSDADEFDYHTIDHALTVYPEVNNNGFIRLRISIESGDYATHARSPTLTTRAIASEVLVKHGHTLAIGSMSITSEHNSEVPDLAKMPYLKQLFNDKAKATSDKKLLIFVTATILNPAGTTYDDTLDPSVLQEMGITDSDIP